MSTQSVSNENIVVLNNNYQYDSSKQTENALWVDLNNVMSVKRDKTIYAVRARNTFDFTQGINNTVFFANTSTAYQKQQTLSGDYLYGTTFTSNIYRGFGTDLTGSAENIFMTAPANVYGNLSADVNANLTQLGIGGSLLEKNFAYNVNGYVNNTINVQSNVCIYGNLSNANQLNSVNNGLPSSFNTVITGNSAGMSIQAASGSLYSNVDGNTCYQRIFYNTDNRTQWNRLINATINGNVCVNASVDPCDQVGNPNPIFQSNTVLTTASVQTNEAYRHQFQLRKNNNSLAYQDPIYIARVSRFGKNLSDLSGGIIASNVSLHSFTGNFAASLPGDNSLYAKGNTISSINITGNINNPGVKVFNSNFLTGNLYNTASSEGNFNGNRIDNLPFAASNNQFLKIESWTGATIADYVTGGPGFSDTNGNISSTGTFQKGDHPGFVQANVSLNQGYILLDRINFQSSPSNYIKSSQVFSANGSEDWTEADYVNTGTSGFDNQTVFQNYQNLWFQTEMYTTNTPNESEISAKYIVITGLNNISASNWNTVSLMTPNSISMPTPSGNPNLNYLNSGNTVNLLLCQGSLSMANYTYVNNKTLTGVNYLTSVPSFVSNVSLPNGNITLSANVMETSGDILGTVPATFQFNNSSLSVNTTSNYNFIFSGNTSVNQTVVLNSNVVMTVNSANSFISSCWNYNNVSANIYGTPGFSANICSNVMILYGENPALINNQLVPTLSLNSPLANENIQYNLEFVHATGQTSSTTSTPSAGNYGFSPNIGPTPSTGPSVAYTNANQLSATVLNQNKSINSMQLPDVAFTEYTFPGGYSQQFTDVGNVIPNMEAGTNFNTNYIVPSALLNTNSGLTYNCEFLTNDSFLNILASYTSPLASNNNIHEVICYNFQYRYGVSSVTNLDISNDVLLNGSTFLPENLFSALGSGGVNPVDISGPLQAAPVSCYVYENLDNSNGNVYPEQVYPFCLTNNDNTLVSGTTVNNLFPGFVWRQLSLNNHNYFVNKGDNQVDFLLPNNAQSLQTAQLVINSVDTVAGTMKVGLTAGQTTINPKLISINPIVHGTTGGLNVNFATPVVCGVQGEPNTYVIFMIQCDMTTGGLVSGLSLPATINVNINNKNSNQVNEVLCNTALRVVDSNGNLNTAITGDYLFSAPVSMFTYATSVSPSQANSATMSLNVFSVPSNNSIVSFLYQQNLIQEMLAYKSQNYNINSLGTGYIASSQSSTNFASFLSNANNQNAIADTNCPYNMTIPALSTRYYLDGLTSGIFIDISSASGNNGFTSAMPKLTVYRSVEWVLKRTTSTNANQIVGRGLLSKSSQNPASSMQNYIIYENLLGNNLPGSGYLHNIFANLNDLSTRCVLQSIQTNSLILNGTANKNNWQINTKGDDLNITLVKVLPTNSASITSTVKQATIHLSSSGISIDLGLLFAPAGSGTTYANTIGIITLGPMRGFTYNPTNGSGLDITQSSFTYLIQPDNYALVQSLPAPNAPTTYQVMTYQNVAFTQETQVTTTDNPDSAIETSSLTLSLSNASLAYQYLGSPQGQYLSPALSSSSFVLIGTYSNNGYGQVQYTINDFTSNYETELETLSIDSSSQNLAILGDSTQDAWQVPSTNTGTTSQPINIKWDPAAVWNPTTTSYDGKYYFVLNEANPTVDRFYFRGVGEDSLPTQLAGATTLLLYTGLRPLVLNVLDVKSNSTSLQNVITSASTFIWNGLDVDSTATLNRTPNIFTSTALSVATTLGGSLSAQYYQIVLTNASAATQGQHIYFRANEYTPTNLWLSPSQSYQSIIQNQNFFGSYVNASSLFDTLRLNVVRDSGINTTYNLSSTMRTPLENPQKSDDDIISDAITNGVPYGSSNNLLFINNGSASFTLSGGDNPQNFGDMCTLTIQGYLPTLASGNGNGFQLNIQPSTLTLYTALDINDNGEIDISQNNNVNQNINGLTTEFGLQNMYSELNFKLPYGTSQYLKPAVLTSWTLDRNFHSVPGAPFDMNLNNLFAVGYNLDCFFTIRNNIAAEFDVITIATAATTNPDGTSVNNLVVQANTAPLIIANPNDWARSISSGAGVVVNPGDTLLDRSGLTFKLKSGTTIVNARDIVRLYVDNTIAANTLEWSVSVAGQAAKTYQLSAYDQDRYSALLDEQLYISNSFN